MPPLADYNRPQKSFPSELTLLSGGDRLAAVP